ncbi:MAG: hypothetical protein AAFN77_08300 [Planctomycetota bacterium]
MLSLVLGITALMPSQQLLAQSQPEPAVVISIAKFDEQLKDVNHILTASGFPEMKFIASAAIKGYTKGLDTKRNAGVMLFFSERMEAPDFLAFVPVADIDDMLDVVSGMAEVDEDGDLFVVVAPDGTEILIKEQSGYAFISTNEDMLKDLPADPGSTLGDMPTKFNLAAKVMPERIPEELKDEIVRLIEEGSEQTMDNLGDDIQSELQRKNFEMQMQQMEMVLDQTKEMTFGMCVDQDTNSMFMDVFFTAKDGTELAKKMANAKPTAPSRFSGFLMDKAAVTMNSNSRMDASDAKTYSDVLDDLKEAVFEEMDDEDEFTEDERDTLQDAVSDIFDVVKTTMSEGVFDGGMVVMLDGDDLNFAAGMQVSDPIKIQNTVKKLVPMIEKRAGDKVEVKLDVRKYKGVNFHEILVPIPDSEEEMQAAFGDELKLVLGMGNQSVYVAGGNKPNELLKKAMDETNIATDMQQFNVYVTPILKTISKFNAPVEMEVMADKLAEVGKDRISVVTNLIENGTHTRFEMQDGILSLIKVGFESFQGGGFPDDDF